MALWSQAAEEGSHDPARQTRLREPGIRPPAREGVVPRSLRTVMAAFGAEGNFLKPIDCGVRCFVPVRCRVRGVVKDLK